MSEADTLPKLLVRNARGWPREIALRDKEFGIWRSITWAEYEARTRAFALGLRSLGLAAGDVVGLIGDNRPDWIMGEIATHAIGARSLGVYRDALEDEVAYLLEFAGAKAVIAEDEEQVDKLLGIGEGLPALRHIIYCDPRGMRKHEDPRLLAVADLVARGEAAHRAAPEAWAAMVAATRADDIAILCTTSGTTARPKLAMLTSGAMVRHCAAYLRADPKGPQDEYVSVLPLPWIMEQIYCVGWGLLARMKVNFVEEPETMMADFREIGPTFVLFAPRVWEAIAAEVRAKVMDASPFKRRMYELGAKLGLEALDKGARSLAADQLLFRALRDRLGFTNLTSAATGGAALGPDTFRFFQAMGVPLRQIYGQTETLGAYTVHRPGEVDQDTVGVAFTDEIETRIDNPDHNGLGEIVTRHPNMFSGYFGMTETADLRDGWLHTGDAGYFDKRRAPGGDRPRQGHRHDERRRSLQRLSISRTSSSSAPTSPRRSCWAIARPHLAALLCIRFAIVSKWAERSRIAFTTYSDLAARDGGDWTCCACRGGAKVNATLPEKQRIQRIRAALQGARRRRRGADAHPKGAARRHQRRNTARSSTRSTHGAEAIPVDTTIAFQDGTTQRIRTTLRVVALRRHRPRQTRAFWSRA